MEITTLLIAGIMFFVLSILLAVYSWKLFKLTDNLKGQLPLLRSNKNQVAMMTILIAALFFSRAIRDFVAAAGVGKLYFVPPSNETLGEQALLFTLYFAWELIPTGFVIALFWHIPRTQLAKLPIFSSYGTTEAGAGYLPPHLQYASIQGDDVEAVPEPAAAVVKTGPDAPAWSSNAPSRLFNDPQRYDSDDESDILRKPKTFATPARNSLTRFGSAGTSSSSQGDRFQGFAPYNTNSPFNRPLD
eukprot:TRINITY_DN5463_c0_g1_i2.p1 TRINITY_DN5463_c0_g1~~TRINITY_DN5463_c0_g1_i2.p1  ORF type:complete len:245 (+),score=36.77 TRINITY_DN5463_c0_g1_i2:404-1138(+)